MNYHKIVTDKGGKVLEQRTKVKGLEIGDTFALQSLKGPYEVLFFYKDKIFDYYPMVFGLCRKTGLFLLCSCGVLNILEKNNKLIKRKRRI